MIEQTLYREALSHQFQKSPKITWFLIPYVNINKNQIVLSDYGTFPNELAIASRPLSYLVNGLQVEEIKDIILVLYVV